MAQQGEWLHSLFDCFSPMNTCCQGFWCPCILYGKTKALKDGNPNVSACNGPCMAWGALCTFINPAQALLSMSQRGQIRRRYGIEGNGCKDCCLSWCCGCCTLIQEDKEIRARERAVPQVEEGYVAPNGGQGMVYQQTPVQPQPVHAHGEGYGKQKVGVV